MTSADGIFQTITSFLSELRTGFTRYRSVWLIKIDYYKIFWIFVLSSFISPYFDFPYYMYDIKWVAHLFKIPLMGLVFVTVIFHLRHKLIFGYESKLFVIFGSFSFLYGICVNQKVDSILLSHIYTAVMPIFAMSFGVHFAKEFNEHTKKFVFRIMNMLFYLTLISLLLYYYFYYIAETFGYFGYGSGMPFVAAFLLTQRKYFKYLLGLVLVVLSAKRAAIVAILLVMLFHVYDKMFYFFNPRRIVFVVLVLISIWYGFFYAKDHEIFRRFEYTYDLQDEQSIVLATGGRWLEIVRIKDYFEENPIKWIIGAGMGGQYLTEQTIGLPDLAPQHYAHFSPASYVFLYGVPFTILLYTSLLKIMLKGIRFTDSFFYLGFIVLFVTSFFGSTLFIDPKIWFFFGVVKFLLRSKNNCILLKS